MILPYSWIKELSGVDWPVDELVRRLTAAGVAGVAEKHHREHFDHVVTGKIVKLDKHPQADKLQVAVVDTGNGIHTVVCGAPNCAVGQIVALALPGANLKGEFPVKEITMRGVKSAGMICAEDELGLSDDHSGIMILDSALPLGQPIYDTLGLDDAIINFEITPNRPDCLSAIGVARESAVLAGKDFRFIPPVPKEIPAKASDRISVKIEDPDGCPRYTARVIDNIKIGESPQWLKKRLTDCGVRPINNVVDISNLVMLETGHPLHAFDYDRFGSREVVVRKADAGEKFITLDGKEHLLDESVLMITNGKDGVAAAGVMGGLYSEVVENTKTVLLEAAYFDPGVIRRSARKLGMTSESAYRFERGVDPEGVVAATNRAAALMAELAGGEVLSGIIDNYAKKIAPKQISLRLSRIKRLLGAEIELSFVKSCLERLGMTVIPGDPLVVTAPTFRPDLEREVDLIEEIARIYGLDNIPVSRENSGPLYSPTHRRDTIKTDLRNIMTGLGYEETLGSGMAQAERLGRISPEIKPVLLTNPLSDEFAVLRPNLLYSLLTSAGNNVRHRNIDLKIFEIGRIYIKGEPEHQEEEWFGILQSGNLSEPFWKNQAPPADLFDIKGVLTCLSEALETPSLTFEPCPHAGYDSTQSFNVVAGKTCCGRAGKVDPKAGKLFDIKQDCFVAELNIATLISLYQGIKPFQALPRFPASTRDIAIIIDDTIPAGKIHEAIVAVGGDLIETVGVFDLFTGGSIPAGKKSVAFSISFRSPEKTLEDKEVDALHGRIVADLEKNFNARLRE
jgi:phenylalanyl-tRNA synthetase beta chain